MGDAPAPPETRTLLAQAVAQGEPDIVASLLGRLTPGDAAEALHALSAERLAATVTLLGPTRLANLLERMAAEDAAWLLLKLSRPQAADVLEMMADDDAADVVAAFSPADAEAVLVEMAPVEAADVRMLLRYSPDSAAGLMTRAMVTVSPDVTADEALAAVRRLARDAETIDYLYVTEADDRLTGVLSLRELVLSPPGSRVGELARRDVTTVRADVDQEIAARLLSDRDLLALPVVDEAGRLLGIVTADDAAGVLEEEATEDIARLGGSAPLQRPYLRTSIVALVWKRVPWLLVLFVAEAYTGSVLRFYEHTLATAVSLTFFIPLLIGTGGNTGSQITTTLTRALAVGDLRPRDIVRVLRKELGAGVLLAVIMAIGTVGRAWTLEVEAPIVLAVGASAAAIVVWAALMAAALPLTLRRVGADPALVSAPLITTLVDGTGLVIYFTIANLVLGL
jgi:magnesium transporter